jgi:hypothetical protein
MTAILDWQLKSVHDLYGRPGQKESRMDITWIEPWVPLQRDHEQMLLQTELNTELDEAHPLFGNPALAIARRYDRDDVLFQLSDGRVAEVHLTWRGARETDPRWPRTVIYASITHWEAERIPLLQYE